MDSSKAARSVPPFEGDAKLITVVVPPMTAAFVPVSKESAVVVIAFVISK